MFGHRHLRRLVLAGEIVVTLGCGKPSSSEPAKVDTVALDPKNVEKKIDEKKVDAIEKPADDEDAFEKVELKSWLGDVSADKVAFTEKWRGRDVAFTGVVDDKLDSPPEHWIFVWAGTGGKGLDYPEIVCVVSTRETARFEKGDEVHVKGTVFGPVGIANNVQIFKCALSKVAAKKKKKKTDGDD